MNDLKAFSMKDTFLPLRLSAFPAMVPLLANIEYDFRGLRSFPTRHGVTSADLSDLDHRSAKDSASFVQSWLFFGLLAELTGNVVDRQSVLHLSAPEHGSKLCTRVNLANPYRSELKLEFLSSKTLYRRIRKIVRIGTRNVERIDRLEVAEKRPMPLVLLSVKILLCDLRAARIESTGIRSWPWKDGNEHSHLIPCAFGSNLVSSSARALQRQMITKGWCPSQVNRISSTCDYSMMHYLSTIHRRSSEKSIHQTCSSTHCQAYNSDLISYKTSHTTSLCQCSFICAPTKQINEIINSGGVPLISLHKTSLGKFEIHAHKSKAKSHYTAISHVWSGGLGNVQANALPICQLEYLNTCVSSLPKDGDSGLNYKKNTSNGGLDGKVWISPLGLDNLVSPNNCKPRLFWIDTLCIPVEPDSSKLRLQAINKMDAIYAHAREVIVLDSEVQRISISGTHPCELLAYLAYSSWMGRSWTLQEGAIGRVTYFQFADGALTLQRQRSYSIEQNIFSLILLGIRGVRSIIRHRAIKIEYSERATDPSTGHERTEDFLLKRLQNSLRRGRNRSEMTIVYSGGLIPEKLRLQSFVSIWNELSQRSTTKPEDLSAIFANLLDFNAGQIIRRPRDERMKAILWSSSMIPFSLLYNSGPRFEDGENQRDKWVPTEPKGSRLTNSPSMKWASDGHSLYLSTNKFETPPLAVIVQVDSLPLYCYLVDDENNKMYFVRAVRSKNDAINNVSHEAICIVIEPFPDSEVKYGNRSASQLALKSRGACLFVISSKQTSTIASENHEQHLDQPSRCDRISLTTIYDCPVRAWGVENAESTPESEKHALENQNGSVCCPILRCKTLKTGYELHLETGTGRYHHISQDMKHH